MLPPEIQRDATLAHVGVAVRNLAEAVGFYRDVLGLEPAPAEAADGATIVAVPAGGVAVELLGTSKCRLSIVKHSHYLAVLYLKRFH